MAYIRRICEVIICLLILIDPFVVCADDEKYLISDNNETIEEFDSYSDAYSYYQEHIDEYDNLIMYEGDTVIHMEYGIVEFMNDGACGIDIEYHSTEKDEDDYLNSCYGVDGAYLYTDKEGKKVYFVLSGDTGYTDIDNVILHPCEKLDVRPSLYENTEDHFIHKIKTQLEQDHYTYSLKLDDPLDSLEKDREYYSYDGHYFYDDFRVMTDDYRNGIRDNAVNAEAYYNYYQYLPYRTLTNYSVEDLNTYFSDVLGIDGRLNHYRDHDGDGAADEINRSQLYGELDDFLIYQYMYGTNGMMLLSTAISESSYGRSKKSYSENNLFSIAAYETQKELEHSRYDTIDNSIYSYSKYFISKMLANHMRSDYTGTYPGNRLSGINVSYCLDSYYGERCASSYYELDSKLGGRDRDVYALGIIKDAKSVTFYKDQELENKRYVVKDIDELSLVILAEYEDSYKIQTDYSFSQDCLYDFEDCVAYVRRDVFSDIVNGENIFENEYVTVHYDFGEGQFRDYPSLDMKYRKDDVPLEPKAKREGYEFAGYDEELVAQYREIESIELNRKNVSAVGLNDDIDLKGLNLKVRYADGETSNIEVDTDMILAYDKIEPGKKDITVNYAGIHTLLEASFDESINKIRDSIFEAIAEKDYDYVRKNIGKVSYPLTFSEIRTIDHDLKDRNGRNYVIKDEDETRNISISGLDLSLPDRKSFSFVEDTYYVIVDDIRKYDEKKITDLASGYGFEPVKGLDISFRFNYQTVELEGPAIVQIAIEDKKNDLIYSVYHLNKDGDIVKCRTTQSDNYIQFMIEESGAYEVLSLPSVNEFDFEDQTEDLSYENMGTDNHRINFSLMFIVTLALLGIIGIIVYYIISNLKRKTWKDFKKSLRTAESVQEEKPKN